MYDLSQPNQTPGTCGKCNGTGEYSWGVLPNGQFRHTGTCFSCSGTGHQDGTQIKRNRAYNRYKIALIAVGA